jgi:hypothetical protein
MSRATKRKEQLALAKQYRKRQETAWHESAHAVVCEYFDIEVSYVTCDPLVWKGQPYLGYCMTAAEEKGQLFEITNIQGIYTLMHLASGSVCEWKRGTMQRGYVDPLDLEEMIEIAQHFEMKPEKHFEIILNLTEEFLQFHLDVVQEIALQLLDRGRIEGCEVRQIVRSHIGYVPQENQTKLFEGLIVDRGSEAETRKSWMARVGQTTETGT